MVNCSFAVYLRQSFTYSNNQISTNYYGHGQWTLAGNPVGSAWNENASSGVRVISQWKAKTESQNEE